MGVRGLEVPLANCLYPHCISYQRYFDGTGKDGWVGAGGGCTGSRRVSVVLCSVVLSVSSSQPNLVQPAQLELTVSTTHTLTLL